MKLSEFVYNLQNLLKKRPELADAEAIYAIDEEGNEFHPVYFDPTPGYYDTEERDWVSEDGYKEHNEFFETELTNSDTNAVVIN